MKLFAMSSFRKTDFLKTGIQTNGCTLKIK